MQFIGGKTSISEAVDGVIVIFTIAVWLILLCSPNIVVHVLDHYTFQVTIVVVAVPEGLPLAVTLT